MTRTITISGVSGTANTLYIGWERMPPAAAERVRGAEPGSEDEGGTVWGDFLKEVTPEGELAWEWHAHSDLALEDFPLHPMSTRLEFAHCNACEELPDGNIMLSFRRISTVLIVDKRTKAVDWFMRDDEWGQQHDCTMLENGNILLFANGIHVPRGVFHSAVVEIDPRTRQEVWRYEDAPRWNFFSPNISGAQRLRSGNTLICEGLTGRLFEVTPDGEIVWVIHQPLFRPGRHGPGQSRLPGLPLPGRLARAGREALASRELRDGSGPPSRRHGARRFRLSRNPGTISGCRPCSSPGLRRPPPSARRSDGFRTDSRIRRARSAGESRKYRRG